MKGKSEEKKAKKREKSAKGINEIVLREEALREKVKEISEKSVKRISKKSEGKGRKKAHKE